MLVIAFIPWLIFWVFLGVHEPKPAALAACLAMLVVNVISLLRGKSLKILQAATFVFFVALSLLAFLTDLNRFWIWVRISASLFLGLVALFSILLKRPFVLQYAREQSSKEVWDAPEFIEKSYAISWVWCGAFFLQLIVPATRIFGFVPPKILGPAFSILVFFAALKFSRLYSR